jgi:hypothetical protein
LSQSSRSTAAIWVSVCVWREAIHEAPPVSRVRSLHPNPQTTTADSRSSYCFPLSLHQANPLTLHGPTLSTVRGASPSTRDTRNAREQGSAVLSPSGRARCKVWRGKKTKDALLLEFSAQKSGKARKTFSGGVYRLSSNPPPFSPTARHRAKMSTTAAFSGFTTLPTVANTRQSTRRTRARQVCVAVRAASNEAALSSTSSAESHASATMASRRTFFGAAFAATLSSTRPSSPSISRPRAPREKTPLIRWFSSVCAANLVDWWLQTSEEFWG